MLKMVLLLAPLLFLHLSVSGQELLQIHHDTMGVSMEEGNLHEVSTSILIAEKWLRTHVLSRYPSTNVTTIVVSNRLLCSDKSFENQEEILRLTLVAMENIHHSLVRWGLERKIKVSVFVTSKCLKQSYLNPLYKFLEEINSTHTLTTQVLKQEKPRSRKLAESDVGYSVPSDAATTPLPPLIGVTSPPPLSLPFAPEMQPPVRPPPPHYGYNLPPCNPRHHSGRGGGGAMAAPPPLVGGGGPMAAPPLAHEGLWCVAKPSVPAEKLQEGIDYACGEGGADCEPIGPTGSCYYPDSIVAHASYAFNSYWQKNKKNGGTCGFGGTAMLINSDPSFLHCHFTIE